MLSRAWVVGRYEWGASFGRWLAPAVLAAFLGVVALGTVWLDDVLLSGVASMRRPLGWMAGCLLLAVPALAMRTFAEERGTGVLQWMGTLPVTPGELVLGRWAAVVAVATVGVLLTTPLAVVLAAYGDLDPGPVLAGYVGLVLLTAAIAAVGVAASAVARTPSLAFVAAVALCAVPALLGWALPAVPLAWVPTVQALALDTHLSSLSRGVVDTRSLVYFGGICVVALRVAVLALEHRRLR
jgi:ABC-2 type transport system permease protein